MKVISITIGLAIFAIFTSFLPGKLPHLIHWIQSQGFWAPLCFILVYVLATLFFLPTMVMTFAGGAIFGPVFGTFYNLTGATLGACLAFLITRYGIATKLISAPSEWLEKLIAGTHKKGMIFVAALRIFPIIPFNLVNYGLGLTHIKFFQYCLITLLALLPMEIVYTYCGYAGIHLAFQSGLIYKRIFFSILIMLCAGLMVFQFIKRRRNNQATNIKPRPRA